MIARDSTRNHEIRYKKGSVEYIEYIGTNKKWIYPQIQMKVKCKFCSKFANYGCMKLPSSKATLPIASFSKQQYPVRERMTYLSLYMSGNKIIVCCDSDSIVYSVL